MRTIIVSLAVLVLCVSMAAAKIQVEYPTTEMRTPQRANTLFAYWDMSDATGFTTIDETATAVPHFHISSFMPFDGTDHWYCGDEGLTADGGYGNSWDDRLAIPATDVTGAYYPVLTFAHYYDSEGGYDFTYVQAKQGGVFVDMNAGYNGQIAGGTWVDIGAYGFVLTGMDNPIEARFRFLSDGAWSDGDGLYLSVGGAYHVDNIKIFDFYGGTVYFFDDVNSGSPCVPQIPGSAGDWWHLVNDVCSSNVIPSWWCGDDADTSLIPPSIANTLITPVADISNAVTCTMRYAIHAEVPQVDNDYWTNSVIVDGVVYGVSAYWGDFGQCDGFGTAGLDGDDISSLLPASSAQYMLTFYTTDNGCGPGTAGGAGINLDDTWFEGETAGVPVENTSWGKIKRMYR
jgi:hypothetical protein